MKRILLIARAILSLSSVVKAQDGNNTSYFLSNLPQQFRLNPAYQPEYKVLYRSAGAQWRFRELSELFVYRRGFVVQTGRFGLYGCE